MLFKQREQPLPPTAQRRCAEEASGQAGPNRPRQHRPAKPGTFKDIKAAKDGIGSSEAGRVHCRRRGNLQRIEIGLQQRTSLPIWPVGDQRSCASFIKRAFDWQECRRLHPEEIGIIGAIAEIEPGQQRIDLVMSGAGRDPKVGMGAQAVGPNTRSKIISMRRK